jgi:hypothetical protein
MGISTQSLQLTHGTLTADTRIVSRRAARRSALTRGLVDVWQHIDERKMIERDFMTLDKAVADWCVVEQVSFAI